MLDVEKLIANLHEYMERAVAPLHDRIKELEARQPERGEAGPQGEPGQDAEPVLVADVVAELVKSEALAPVLDLYVADTVAKHFEAHPVRDGQDGPVGPQGPAGANGRDGLDVKDLFRSDGGHLIAVMSDGTTKDMGRYVGADGRDGADGKDGADGLGFEDATLEIDGEDAVLRLIRGDVVKELRIPMVTMKHIGFWRHGIAAKAGETTTHDGSLWLALRDTEESPSYQSKDWQLAARKGADGQRGKDGKDYRPVSLKPKKDADDDA